VALYRGLVDELRGQSAHHADQPGIDRLRGDHAPLEARGAVALAVFDRALGRRDVGDRKAGLGEAAVGAREVVGVQREDVQAVVAREIRLEVVAARGVGHRGELDVAVLEDQMRAVLAELARLTAVRIAAHQRLRFGRREPGAAERLEQRRELAGREADVVEAYGALGGVGGGVGGSDPSSVSIFRLPWHPNPRIFS